MMATQASPPAPGFRLVRHFTVASLVAMVLVAAALLYFQFRESDFFKSVQQQQGAFFARMQDGLVQRHDAEAVNYLLRVYEAGNVNLTRLFENALWDKDVAPLVAKAQRIAVDACRGTAEVGDAGGKTGPPVEKHACYAGIGTQIRALPEFRSLDAKLFDLAKNSRVLKLNVYDLRGVTVYSSEHDQIGRNPVSFEGWKRAAAGETTSELTHRDKFHSFHGVVDNRDMIASYVPLIASGSDRPLAVVEVYSDATQFLQKIKSTSSEIRDLIAANRARLEETVETNQGQVDARRNRQYAIALALFALLYLALFLIVRNGQRVIDGQDIERGQAALALRRQKDLYDVLSQTNKAIVHLVDSDALFAAICRIAVEHGRFRFAWISLVDAGGRRLTPVARFGEDVDGYIEQINLRGDDARDAALAVTIRTLASGSRVVSNDFLNDPRTAPWHEAARRAGVRASAKFPIREGGAVIGSLNVCAGEPGFFTDEVIATLDEIASDVSFALDNYAREAARKQADALVRHGEQRLRIVLQTSMDSFWILDTKGCFLDVNDAYCRMTGYRREELLKMHISDVEATESPEDIARHIQKIMASGGDSFETRHRCKDGQLVDVEVSANFVADQDGERFFAFIRDITERKRAEEALRTAAEQFRGLVEQSIAGIYIVQDGRLAYVNPRFAEILGYDSAAELTGSDVSLVIVEDERAAVVERVRDWLKEKSRSISYTTRALRKDGSAVEVGVHAARASHQNRPAIIGLMQDIAEKKRAEEQIQHYIAQIENSFMRTVEIATTLSEMRDPYTAGHERRVANIAVAIGAELGFDARRQEGLRVAGYLHDIGKITIPSEILSKPGRLTAAEFALIKEHAQASYDVLKGVEFPWPVAEVAQQHHERIDGSGYPRGLKGEAILPEARIMAVADVVEAMSSHRPYRPGLGIDKALAEIERGRGIVYDANVADACLRLFREKGYTIPA